MGPVGYIDPVGADLVLWADFIRVADPQRYAKIHETHPVTYFSRCCSRSKELMGIVFA